MKTFKRIIFSLCVMLAAGLMLWSCAKDYARTDITLEMTDEDSVDAIIDHDLLTVGGTIINIEEPQETHTPVVEYVDEIDITTPEIEEEDISEQEPVIVQEELEKEIEKVPLIDEEEPAEMEEPVVSEEPETVEESETTEIAEKVKEKEPLKIDDIFASETLETEEVEKKEVPTPEDIVVKEKGIPTEEDVEKLKKEAATPATDVEELIKRPGTKKSLDEFVSPLYDDKRIKTTFPTHTVVRGDTLWSIGRKYGCTISELCHANNISRRKVLRIGQALVIPVSKGKPVKPEPESASKISGDTELELPPPVVDKPEKVKKPEEPETPETPKETTVTATEYYTVKKGDCYWKIAREYGVSSSELMKLNNTTSTLIRPGQKILVPEK